MKIAFLYEHPTWSDELIRCFSDNDIQLEPINIAETTFDTDTCDDFDLWVNRINVMPSADRNPAVVFHTLHFLHFLEQNGAQILNGARAHYTGTSKALQNCLFAKLGVGHPRAIAIYRLEDAPEAAKQIGYPLIIKPNIGGSGSGVAKYDDEESLLEAVRFKQLDLGVDRTGLAQEYIESDGYIYRVEILGDEMFYAIHQKIQQGTFNYCAADGCHTDSGNLVESGEDEFDFCVVDAGDRIEPFQPESAIVRTVTEIVQAAGADVGGVEYLLNTKTGQPCYYDFNPYSNFVSDGKRLLGFSPEQRFVDFVRSRVDE